MRGETTMYVIAIIVLAHFVIGIGYLMYKLSKPSKKKSDQD